MKSVCCVTFALLVLFQQSARSQWQQTNGPYGGFVWTLTVDQHGHLYAGTENKGLFRAADLGGSWAPCGLTRERIVATELHPDGALFVATNTGLFRSTDDGETWLPTGISNSILRCMKVHHNGAIYAAPDKGLLKSTDAGMSWTTVLPTSFGKVTALLCGDTNSVFAGGEGGIYRSSNGEVDTWRKVSTVWTAQTFFKDPAGILYAGCHQNGVLRSVDNGFSWTAMGLTGGHTVSSFCKTATGPLFAGVYPLDPSIPGGMYVSADTGWTWSSCGLQEWSIYSTLALPSGEMLLGSTRGVFISTDSGNSWGPHNEGLAATNVCGLATCEGGIVIAGTSVGVFRSSNEGNSWEECGAGIYPPYISCLATDHEGRVFLGTTIFSPDGGVYRSTDQGGSWALVSRTAIQGMYLTINTIAITDSDVVYAAEGKNIYRSADHGSTWTKSVVAKTVNMLAVDPAGRIFGATWGAGVIRSTDFGHTWTSTTVGLPNPNLYSVVVKDTSEVYVGGIGGVSRSTDHGTTWSAVTMNSAPAGEASAERAMDPRSTTAILVVRAMIVEPGGDLLISTADGRVLSSSGAGDPWTEKSGGLPAGVVNGFANSVAGTVYAGTDSSGVFKLPATPLPVQLRYFKARCETAGFARLEWATASEIHNFGFVVEKKEGVGGAYAEIQSAFVPGHGTTVIPQYYLYVDSASRPGIWYYRLKQVDLDGAHHYSEGVRLDILSGIAQAVEPSAFRLEQNYPNPFNPTSIIEYAIAGVGNQASGFSRVKLAVYDMLGREVAVLVDKEQAAGRYSVRFSAADLPSGVYLYRLQARGLVEVKKLLLMR